MCGAQRERERDWHFYKFCFAKNSEHPQVRKSSAGSLVCSGSLLHERCKATHVNSEVPMGCSIELTPRAHHFCAVRIALCLKTQLYLAVPADQKEAVCPKHIPSAQ